MPQLIAIGIDPGADGGCAIIPPDRRLARAWSFSNKTEREIFEILTLACLEAGHVFLEKVHGMPRQAGQFKFGQNYGLLRGILLGQNIPFEDVTPQAWQRGVGIGGSFGEYAARKRKQRETAQNLFPHIKVTNSVADALLIAEHGWRTLNR